MDKKPTDVTDNKVGKMTDSEIVKALKCLLQLVLVEGCLQRAKTISNALDLINRLQAENKRLSTLAELGNKRANDYRVMRDRALKAEAENERLKEPTSASAIHILAQKTDEAAKRVPKFISEIKAEAYKECIEKVKNELKNIAKIDWQDNYYYLVGTAFFDNLLKELVGE